MYVCGHPKSVCTNIKEKLQGGRVDKRKRKINCAPRGNACDRSPDRQPRVRRVLHLTGHVRRRPRFAPETLTIIFTRCFSTITQMLTSQNHTLIRNGTIGTRLRSLLKRKTSNMYLC